MRKIVDLTVTVSSGTKSPPSTDMKVELTEHHRGPGFWQVTSVNQSLHTGTHIDSALHCFEGGATTAEFPLDQVCGMATVLDCSYVEAGEPIEVKHLAQAAKGLDLPAGDILIVRTDWTDKNWGNFPDFFVKSPYLTAGAAEWLVSKDPKAFCFDFFEEYSARLPTFTSEDFIVHKIMLETGKPLLEQATNLGSVGQPRFEFFAPFYKIAGTEGAPARFFAMVD